MPSDGRRDDSLAPAVGALLVAGLAAVAHAEVLGLWFTGTDTIPLIESSRVRSVGDAATLLFEPLMAGTAFVESGLFYRPVVGLSFALDYALWGLDPTGYHLTDLLLHAGTAALVALLVRAVSDGDGLAGVLAGAVFALHPLTLEVVPSPARRQDVLATLFVVLAALLFVRGLRRDRPRFAVASAGAFLLALGSKETAIVLPALVGSWFVFHEVHGGIDRRFLRRFARRGVVYGSPFAVATVAYFAVRFAVLGGLGGYDRVGAPAPATRLARRYARSLLYPVDHLHVQFGIAVDVVPDGLLLLAGASVLLIGITLVRRGRTAVVSARARRLAFFALWSVLPFTLVLYTGRYALRSGYLSLAGVGGVVGLLLSPPLRDLVADREVAPGSAPDLGAAVIAALLVASLIAGSPLVRPCDGWGHASDVTRQALTGVEAKADDLPEEGTVALSGVPHSRSARLVTELPRARSVTYFWGHSVSSWLQLRGAGNVTFAVDGTTNVTERRVDVRAVVVSRSEGYDVELTYAPRSGGPPDAEAGRARIR